MSDILFPISGGGGGGNLDEITASAEHVKSPYTFMNSEGDIEEGTMVDRENWGAAVGMNDRVTVPEGYHDGSGEVYGPTVTQRGAWTSRLGINGKVMIPEGYHNGNGYVDQDISTLGEQKVVPKLSRHTLWTADQYMTGNVIIEPIPNQKNASTKALSNGVNQQGLYFYIPEGYYLPDGTGNSWVYQTLAEVAKALGITPDKVKKGVTLCGVVGTFEGWVPVATDLYYNGANANGFTIYGAYARLENNRIYFIKTSSASPVNSTYKDPNNDYGAFLRFGKTVDVRSYTKMIFEGNFYGPTSSGKSNFAIFDSSGTIRYKESNDSGNIVPQAQIVIDITQSSYINAGSYMKFGGRDGGYITRIRLA